MTKKTRDLPNVTECHCCHLRIDLAKSKSKLHLLYSEWRIVLLCKKCLSRVESTELCSYCFHSSSSSGDCFSCRQCKRRVHRDCDSEYRSSAVWSGTSSVVAEEEVAVCGDCWVSESLARWRRSRNGGGGSGRKNRADLGGRGARVLDDENHETKCGSVAVSDSSLRLDVVEEEEAGEIVDDDDDGEEGQLKEGHGSCSNGVESESPPCCSKQLECKCGGSGAKGENGNGKLDPYYFKYRRRRIDDQSLLTYKRRRSVFKSLGNVECPLLTYKRRGSGDARFMLTYKRRGSGDARFMYTYKRRRNFDQSMLTCNRRRPEILYASAKIQLEGEC